MQREELLRMASTLVCQREHALPNASSSLDIEWRLAIFNALRGGNVEYYNVCNLGEILTATKVFTSQDKSSVSDSVIIAGALQPPPKNFENFADFAGIWQAYKCDVIMKASFPKLYPAAPVGQMAPLDAEVAMYGLLTKLVQTRVTPNLVTALGAFDCTFDQLHAAGTPASLLQSLVNEATKVYAAHGLVPLLADPVKFLVLERGRGTSLLDMIKNKSITKAQLISLLAQIIYTIDVLASRGLRHADLHLGNIFIDKLSNPFAMINYMPNPGASTLYLAVPTLGLVAKLYDWDWGGSYHGTTERWPLPSTEILNSVAIQNCNTISSCFKNSKADVFTFLSNLYDLIDETNQNRKMEEVMQFIREVVDERLLQFASPRAADNFARHGGFPYRLCGGPVTDACMPTGVNVTTGSNCSTSWEPSDCYVKPTLEMLQHEIFKSFRRDLQKQPFVGNYVYGDWSSSNMAEQFNSKY